MSELTIDELILVPEILRRNVFKLRAAEIAALPDAPQSERAAERIQPRATQDDLAIVRVLELVKHNH